MGWNLFNEKEKAYITKWYGIKRSQEIADHLGYKSTQIVAWAYRNGLKSTLTKSSILNEKKMRQHPVKLVGEWRGPRGITDFLCPYCSKIFPTEPYKVSVGHTKSCGCTCIAKRKGTKHISGDYWRGLLDNAHRRNYEIDFTIDDIDNLLVQQDFKCALSGLPIVSYGHRRKRTASLDRIDSSLGYTLDNVQWLHKDVNRMKQIFDQNYFIELCKRIASEN